MSRVYFHSPSGDAELRGSERAWLGGLVNDLAVGILALHDPSRVDRLVSLAASDHYIAQHADGYAGMPLQIAYRLAFLHEDPYTAALVQHHGRRIDTFSLALNTAMLLGNDQVRLAARLHAQCELHAWVDGPNRGWLADVMEAGLESGVFRRGIEHAPDPIRGRAEPLWVSQGWEDVITLLRTRDDEPVVTSFSVTEQFPSPGDRWREFGEDGDGWYDLDAAEQWRFAMDWLRQSPGELELRPDNKAYRFGHKLSILDLFARDWEDRLDQALAHEDED